MPAKGMNNDTTEYQETEDHEPKTVDCNEYSPVVLLVTANVGSVFEDPTRLLKPWIREFIKKVVDMQPLFLALHLQEVGGKTYEKSMEYVQEFIRSLCEANEMQDFAAIRIYMDEDFKSAENFTALGNLYFAHKNLKSVKTWNFLTHNWESVIEKNVFSGNIETIPTKEKSKFPQHFFPECKWSRKGFMRTRWEINETVIDLVNIHLFHDASNLAACEEFPSVYCKTRKRALVYTLERFHLDDKNGLAPYFIFGDFNFRCDTKGVIKELTENLTAHRVQSIKNDSTKVHYRNSNGDNIFTIGKKEFIHADHQLKFKEVWLKKFDRELEDLNEILIEYPINFHPSYPYEEDPEMPTDYMSTRCPSWCDRILMSPQAREIVLNMHTNNSYNIIGENVCMGDHKPIYLHIRLKPNQGTYKCCKCYLYNAKNNKSTLHDNPAVTFESESFEHCPYKNQIYYRIVQNCKNLEEINSRNYLFSGEKICLPSSEIVNINSELETQNILDFNKNTETGGERIKYPPVSINIIDSDNFCLCSCSRISNGNDCVDGAICPNCCNIIKKQKNEQRYRIITKRLMLANDIIVNRIDMHYLNTFMDVGPKLQEPYTPESAESHSPYPELNSTTSVNSRNIYERIIASDQQVVFDNNSALQPVDQAVHKHTKLENSNEDAYEKQVRGVVSPVQLKSRLEDLQRLSTYNLYKQNGESAGISDVDYVDDICQETAGHKKHNSCLPECCNIH